jgi:phosphoesterase, MJ0936 family
MKYLVLSDIHGSLTKLEQVLSFFEKENYGMLLLLGDIINYGPRNGLPEGLDGMGVAERLNQFSSKIAAIRGNCDSEVDQMLLKFPCMGDYAVVVTQNGKRVFLSHGHIFTPEKIPFTGADAFFSGHTHLWELEKRDGVLFCNTGSITFPKGGRPATFATIDEDGMVRVRLLDGTVLKEMKL